MNYEILLDDVNQKILAKHRNNKALTDKEKKLLHRTNQVLKNIERHIEFNEKNKDIIDRLF
ncbi:hypothetical protein AAK964_12280 [Tissierella praeacuta]|uniref:hypothetical protein n=1 Tax=Tissierella praeacuta TaxID=43131 RepID=UPI00351829C0